MSSVNLCHKIPCCINIHRDGILCPMSLQFSHHLFQFVPFHMHTINEIINKWSLYLAQIRFSSVRWYTMKTLLNRRKVILDEIECPFNKFMTRLSRCCLWFCMASRHTFCLPNVQPAGNRRVTTKPRGQTILGATDAHWHYTVQGMFAWQRASIATLSSVLALSIVEKGKIIFRSL